MKKLIDSRILLKNDHSKMILKLPLKKRKAAYRALMDKKLKSFSKKFPNSEYRVVNNYGAPRIIRGFFTKAELTKISLLKYVSHARPTYGKPRKEFYEPQFYWALVKDSTSIEGLKRKRYFFYSIAFQAESGREAMRKAKKITKPNSKIIYFDHKFRKNESKSEVLFVERCDTQMYHKNPQHIVMLRVSPETDKHLSISTIIKQKVDLF